MPLDDQEEDNIVQMELSKIIISEMQDSQFILSLIHI